MFIIDEFCTINECIIIYRDLDSFPQVLHIILLGNLWVLDFMDPKHHEMWMNSRYDLWYLFRHIWATFSFIWRCLLWKFRKFHTISWEMFIFQFPMCFFQCLLFLWDEFLRTWKFFFRKDHNLGHILSIYLTIISLIVEELLSLLWQNYHC